MSSSRLPLIFGCNACVCACAKSIKSCPTLCGPPGYSVYGILQAKILEWVAMCLPQGDLTHQKMEPQSLMSPNSIPAHNSPFSSWILGLQLHWLLPVFPSHMPGRLWLSALALIIAGIWTLFPGYLHDHLVHHVQVLTQMSLLWILKLQPGQNHMQSTNQ